MSKTTRSPLKVFLVEDSALLRERIVSLIEPRGDATVVGEAEDVATALAGIEASEAEAVLVDLRLTDSSGLDLLAALGRLRRRIVKIVLTNYSSPMFREASIAAGADFFFDKTSEFDLASDTLSRIARTRPAPFTD